MYGIIFDIQRYSIHDGPGIRTNVFFKGCNLKCKWCHNPESQSAVPELMTYAEKCVGCGRCEAVRKSVCQCEGAKKCTGCGKCAQACEHGALEIVGKRVSEQYVLDAVLKDKKFYITSGGGVTLSGGEPLLQADFALAILKGLKESGIHTAVETAGNVPLEVIKKVLPYVDLFLYDIKGIDEEKHRENTGVSNKRILENAEYIKGKTAVLFRMPVVPCYNMAEVQAVKGFAGAHPLELLAYHTIGKAKYNATGRGEEFIEAVPPTEEEMKALAESVGAIYNPTGM